MPLISCLRTDGHRCTGISVTGGEHVHGHCSGCIKISPGPVRCPNGATEALALVQTIFASFSRGPKLMHTREIGHRTPIPHSPRPSDDLSSCWRRRGRRLHLRVKKPLALVFKVHAENRSTRIRNSATAIQFDLKPCTEVSTSAAANWRSRWEGNPVTY